jgi:uncharacterized protein
MLIDQEVPKSHQAPKSHRQLRILSHNPLVPVLVPDELIDRFRVEEPAGIVSAGPLTTPTTSSERRWDSHDGLAKLVLQVAHRCNLTCAYCISDAGKWGGSEQSMMSADVAAQAVRFFAQEYHSIGTVYLFGGEPTLNLGTIEAACREVKALLDEGVLAEMPDIGFTSNGTVVNDRLIRLLNENPNLKMSVSVDGPAEIHDVYRLDVGGKPTYHKIVKNIKRLREETGRPKTLEVTYNLSHRRSGLSLWEIMNTLREDTGVGIIGVEVAYNTSYSKLNFDPLIDDLERSLDDIEDALSRSIESIASTDDPLYYYHIIAFMGILFQEHRPNFCPAARNYFTVSKDGAVYPCQNLPETPAMLLGHLDDPDLGAGLRRSPVIQLIDKANHQANDHLGEQWFANFCKICPAYNLGETKTTENLAPSRIKLYERMASTFLTGLLEVAESEERHARFLSNVARTSGDTFELNMF